MKKEGQKEIEGIIHLLSGTRIGGSDDLLQIGGTDLTCIKHPVTLQPYLPGSSLKGKMRSEMERKLGKFSGNNDKKNEPCNCAKTDCFICRVFGPHKKPDHNLGPSRIIVRDAPLHKGGEIELKSENIIDRRVGTALHPRKVERVVAGSEFNFKLIIQYLDIDTTDPMPKYNDQTGADALVEFVKDAMRELQRTGIGGGVSKGYGEFEFKDLKLDGQSFSL